MSLYADRYVSPRRADAFLLVVDSMATAAAMIFATGALDRRTAVVDTALISAWAAIPHIIARVVRSRSWPTDFQRSIRDAIFLVLFAGALTWAGWDLIGTERVDGPTLRTAGLVVAFWLSGFLLFAPPTYRLFDSLGGGVLLLALLEDKGHSLVLCSVWLVATLLSSPARHQLFDVFAFVSRPRINLQNVRVIGSVGAACCVGALLLLANTFEWIHRETAGPVSIASTNSRPRARSRPSRNGPEGPSVSARTIGFTDEVGLSDLGPAQKDTTPVLRVTVRDPGVPGRRLGPEDGLPSAAVLWRATAMTSIDIWARSWMQFDSDFRPVAGPYIRRPLPKKALPATRVLDVEVLEPVFSNLVSPYWTSRIGRVRHPVAAGGAGERVRYLRNQLLDIVPSPALARGTRYQVVSHLRGRTDGLLEDQDQDRNQEPLYLELPTEDDTGVNLGALAQTVFAGARTPREKVDALRRFFERNRFEYDREVVWTVGDNRLRAFLLETRKGDCVYYATASALLLRAANIPARLAIGYNAWEWEPETRTFIIRNGTAHAWTEIAIDGLGWYPVDPVQWVPEGDGVAPAEWFAEAGNDVAARSRWSVLLVILGALLLLADLVRKQRLGVVPGRGLQSASDESPPVVEDAVTLRLPPPQSPRDAVLRAYQRLQQQLRKKRRHRRPSTTPREHAASLAEENENLTASLTTVEQAVYRSVYGAQNVAEEEAEAVAEAVRRIGKNAR